ncbi:MAG: DUF4123 domain-containing protein [Acidobacteriota bacterium]
MTPALLLDELCPLVPERRAFALIDAAREPGLFRALVAGDCTWAPLYRGQTAVRMAEVAPYLVQLDRQSRLTPWLLEQGWGRGWAVFCNAETSLDDLRSHFRRLLMARLPDDRMVYFRFYDPRILRAFLPTCTPDELTILFGPVERYVLEEDEGNGAVAFQQRENQLVWTRM